MVDHWCKDEGSEECLGCKVKFTIYERRHHCRACGKLFCSSCSQYQSEIPKMKILQKVRVCKSCFDQLRAENQSPDHKKWFYLSHWIKLDLLLSLVLAVYYRNWITFYGICTVIISIWWSVINWAIFFQHHCILSDICYMVIIFTLSIAAFVILVIKLKASHE